MSKGERGNGKLRRYDRWLGIPLVFAIGLFRPRRPMPQKIDRVGLLCIAAIGDTLLAGSGIKALREKYPNAEIILFVSQGNVQVGNMIGGFDQLVELPALDPLKALRQIRLYALDVLIDFGPWPRLNALIAGLGGAKHAIGFKTKGQYRHFLFDTVVEHLPELHAHINFGNLYKVLGTRNIDAPYVRPVSMPAEKRPSAPWVVCHPWSGGWKAEVKEWRAERWHAIARYLVSRGYTVVFTGGPRDADRSHALLAPLSELGGSIVDTAARLSLTETAGLLLDATLTISIDNGVMHLAAATGGPLVALMGPTAPNRWGPLSKAAVAVTPGLEGCGYLSFNLEHRPDRPDCMGAITVDAVLRAVALKLPEEVATVDLRRAHMGPF